MRGFTQRPNVTRRSSSATPARPATLARSLADPSARSTQGAGVAGSLLHLQRTIGNQAVGRLLPGPPTRDGTQSAAARTRLTVNTPGDTCEQEADRIAARVTDTASRTAGGGAPLPVQRVSASSTGPLGTAPASIGETLSGAGRPLDAALRQDMEQRLGHDFSHVRVHSGASAEQSVRDVNATAYTIGHNVVFGRNRFAPETLEGRRLIAHELTHVVQQSRSPMFHTPSAPAVVQRKTGDAAARAKVVAAMEALKKKWGLVSVTEENGATWSESELKKVDTAFSMLAREEQPLLKSVRLIRTDKFEPLVIEEKTTQTDPKKKPKPKTFQVAGETSEAGEIRLAAGAFKGRALPILHEVGHHVHHHVAATMLAKSRPKLALEAARSAMAAAQKRAPVGSGTEVLALLAAMTRVNSAASALEGSSGETRAAKQSDLEVAKEAADVARSMVELLPKDAAAKAVPFLQLHDAQMVFVDAVEKFAVERDKKNLTEFVDIVNKHRLAQRKYVPFTEYVLANWPHKPWEYFAESFRAWRTDRGYMKANMKPLFEFFEKGGHRVK
jgi:hypothetical protein